MLIRIKDLKKEYSSSDVVTKVLHGVSFDIKAGEFVSIMGPSGSGKSTLMHILGLLDRLSSGIYEFAGEDVSKMDDDQLASFRNEKIGFVFQSFNLLSKTSVLDNVILPLTYSSNRKNMVDRAKKVLTEVGLSHRFDYYTNQISGGEKQRVAIARALVNQPSVIFADEPTGNLDSRSGIQIMQILQKLNEEGNTIILVTHETYTAEHAKRIIKIRDGLIVSDEEVKNRKIAQDGMILK
ncbi:MAG TPA: ABC transporter ATP-binding protein [bacterium]|nr:ABC transporter ATP-binding protein [bacterium]